MVNQPQVPKVDTSPIVHIRVAPAVFKQLQIMSQETGKSMSDLGREALQAMIGMYLNATKK
jgi:hypothetical protein